MDDKQRIETVEQLAKSVVENCPTHHVLEGLTKTLEGQNPNAGPGCACATCIASAIRTERQKVVELEAQLTNSRGAQQRRVEMQQEEIADLESKLAESQKEVERLTKELEAR